MGDYAVRKSDGVKVKIGTCGAMYYMTFDQWLKGDVYGGDASNIREYIESMTFRLPLASEKDIAVGDFDYHGYYGAEPLRVYLKQYEETEDGKRGQETEFSKELGKFCRANAGTIKMTKTIGKRRCGEHEWDEGVGIYVDAPCYHGYTGDVPKGVGYNGFNPHVLAVTGVAIRHGRARAIMSCIACEHTVCSLSIDELVQNFGCFHEHEEDWEYLIDRLISMDEWAKANVAPEKEVG